MKYGSPCNCLLFLIHLPFVTTCSLFQNDIIRRFYSSFLQCYAVDNHQPLVHQKCKCQIIFSIGQQISDMAEVIGLTFSTLSRLVGQHIYQRTADCRRLTWLYSVVFSGSTKGLQIVEVWLENLRMSHCFTVFRATVMSAVHTAVCRHCRSQLTLPYHNLSFTQFSFTAASASHTWLIRWT